MIEEIRTRSARSSSASLPVPSTRTRAPKILILSVSIAITKGQQSPALCQKGRTGVGNENLGILDLVRAVDTDLLVEDETLVEVRVRELSTLLLDDLDVLQIGRALRTSVKLERERRSDLQAKHGRDGELCKVVLVGGKDLGGEGGAGDGEEVATERLGVLSVVDGAVRERIQCDAGGDTESLDDATRVSMRGCRR